MSKASHSTTATSFLPVPEKSPKRAKARMATDSSPTAVPTTAHSHKKGVPSSHSTTSASTTSANSKGKQIMRNLDRGTPGERAMEAGKKTPEQKEINKQRSFYFDDVFGSRDANSARERITRESMVWADIKTNIIVSDEYFQMNDISLALSMRYNRPEHCIAVTLSHSSCCLLGASFRGAYTMTIYALPSQLQPVTNKRNATLLAQTMEQAIGLPPERGLILFVPISEENFAKGGKTVAGEIEELEKELADENSSMKRSSSRGTPKSRKKQSMKSLRSGKSAENENPIPSIPEQLPLRPLPESPKSRTSVEKKGEKGEKKMSRRKSFMNAVFGKS